MMDEDTKQGLTEVKQENEDAVPPAEVTSEQAHPEQKLIELEKPRDTFECYLCHLKEYYDYYGKKPGFCRNVIFGEDSYVMKDPFSSRQGNNCNFLLLGSNCVLCDRAVCQECSVFYTRRICTACANKNLAVLPQELTRKLEKSD